MASESPTRRLAVVVASRSRPASLGRLLAALERQSLSREAFSVCVVNDGSHDDGYARVLERHPSVRYLALPRRLGPAGARNCGAAASSGEWLVFTDDDCLPPPDWLENFGAFHGADAVGGRVELGPRESLGTVGRYLKDISFIRPILGPDGSILCLPTANLAVRREWFERVAGFDARFPLAGGEDMDLTCRLARSGARLEIADDWVTYHESPEGLADLCGRYFRYGRGEALFRRLRLDAGLPPPVPYARRIRTLLGGPSVEGDLSFRLLTATRQISYELGRLYGRGGLGGHP